jgi:GDP-fucose transporter C1
MDLAWYSNLLSAVVMLPLSIIVGEGPNLVDMWTQESGEALGRFLWGGAITVSRPPGETRTRGAPKRADLSSCCFLQGIFGFLICIAGFLSIKVTSPVSHMVSSA